MSTSILSRRLVGLNVIETTLESRVLSMKAFD